MYHHIFRFILAAVVLTAAPDSQACTSAIVGASRTASGRTLMWKHRDTGTEHNFVERVPASDSTMAFVAIFNGGDSLLREAWTGINEAGFAIMNTASYNLAPDTARIKDREGIVMRQALEKCRRVEDFARLLDTISKPAGIQANFGVIDASGNGAYFEADDRSYRIFPLSDSDDDVLIRTNYSYSGGDSEGLGYIRHDNARRLLQPYIDSCSVTPATFTEDLSRSFYHSLLDRDMAESDSRWVVDQDFIPRYSSAATIVIESARPDEDSALSVMWTGLGYPPVAQIYAVSVDSVPSELRPTAPGAHSPACDKAVRLKHIIFPISRGNGNKYIDMEALRTLRSEKSALSRQEYMRRREYYPANSERACSRSVLDRRLRNSPR